MPGKPVATKAVKESDQPYIYQIFRVISKTGGNIEEGHYSVDEVNMYLSSFRSKGYKLFATHYLGEMPEGFNMLYVLVLE